MTDVSSGDSSISKRTVLMEYLAVLLVTGVFLLSVFPVWEVGLQIPLVNYSWDTLSNAYDIKSVIDTGWVFGNPYVGAPYGTNLLDFPASNSLHYAFFFFISRFSSKPFTIYNLYYYLGYILAALSAYYVLRRLGIAFFIALPGALAFAFLPYHLQRYSHLYLASYYMLPLCLLIFYETSARSFHFFTRTENVRKWRINYRDRRLFPYIFICLFTASSGVYYGFFMVLVGLFCSIYLLIMDARERSYARTVNTFLATLLVFSFVMANLAPYMLYRKVNGEPEAPVGQRLWMETDAQGLNITRMFLPSSLHRVPALRDITQRYEKSAILVNEGGSASLGLFGVLGLLTSVFMLLFGPKKFNLIKKSGTLIIFCILVGTIGGLGSLFSYLVNPSMRSLNRLSVIIAFLSIVSLTILLNYLFDLYRGRYKVTFTWLTLAAMLSLVWVDQVYYLNLKPTNENLRYLYFDDLEFAQKIQMEMQPGSKIFQLPYMYFPEFGVANVVTDYDLFKPYLYTSGLYWSYGGVRGRDSSQFAEKTSQLPVDKMLEVLKREGFSGIYIDRLGYKDFGKALDLELRSRLSISPIIRYDQRCAFYFLD